MNDQSGYEFWDYRSKESARQFRIYKEARQILEPYENYFGGLVRGLILSEISSKVKSKTKFELNVGDGDSTAKIELKAQRPKDEVFCKEVSIDYGLDNGWASIKFDAEGKIKSLALNESQKARPTRNVVVVNLISLGKRDIIGDSSNAPIKDIQISTENPENLSVQLYASYSGGLTWNDIVNREGKMEELNAPFTKLLAATINAILPESVRQSITSQV